MNDQNGPKVSGIVALVKFGHMLENPLYPQGTRRWNLAAVKILEVRKISRKGWYAIPESSETTRQTPTTWLVKI
jgi:hypothetical protein